MPYAICLIHSTFSFSQLLSFHLPLFLHPFAFKIRCGNQALQTVSQLTELHILVFCHSRAGGNPVLFKGLTNLDAGSSPA
jgi:hypothetical protein